MKIFQQPMYLSNGKSFEAYEHMSSTGPLLLALHLPDSALFTFLADPTLRSSPSWRRSSPSPGGSALFTFLTCRLCALHLSALQKRTQNVASQFTYMGSVAMKMKQSLVIIQTWQEKSFIDFNYW
jgi:hypothetical protein